MADAMGTESEELRLSVQYRLTKMEAQVAQLVLDHAHLHNLIVELKKIVSLLQNFKMRTELLTSEAEKHSRRMTRWTGIVIAAGTLLIEVFFKLWH